MVKMLVELKQQVRHNTLLLQRLESKLAQGNQGVVEEEHEEEEFSFPLTGQGELLELEGRLKTLENRQKLI